MVDLNEIQLLGKRDGKILSRREAARSMGIPAGLLRLLKERGLYRQEHYTRGAHGFHADDIRKFIEAFSSLPVNHDVRDEPSISLASLVRSTQISWERKIELMVRIKSGEIPVIAKRDNTLNGVRIPERFLRSLPVDHNNDLDGATQREVAKYGMRE
jgi:hypothetical protein